MITPNSSRARMVAGSALVLLFASGIVVGLAWDRTASASTPEVGANERSEREGGRGRMVVDGVGLSTVQKTAVDSLVVFHRERMSDLDTEFQPRYRAVIADLREEIKQVLTDDQRVMYDELLAERDDRRAERRSGNSRR
jgi:hypothetical protein